VGQRGTGGESIFYAGTREEVGLYQKDKFCINMSGHCLGGEGIARGGMKCQPKFSRLPTVCRRSRKVLTSKFSYIGTVQYSRQSYHRYLLQGAGRVDNGISEPQNSAEFC